MSGPLFAIPTIPRAVNFKESWISSLKNFPYILSPPFPVPARQNAQRLSYRKIVVIPKKSQTCWITALNHEPWNTSRKIINWATLKWRIYTKSKFRFFITWGTQTQCLAEVPKGDEQEGKNKYFHLWCYDETLFHRNIHWRTKQENSEPKHHQTKNGAKQIKDIKAVQWLFGAKPRKF